MKRFALPIGVLVAVLLVVAIQQGWAQNSDGKIGEALSLQLYCQTQYLLEGNIGLLLGLILVFGALWALVQGAKIMAVVPLIIIGALMTALPSLVESSLSGLGNLIKQSGMSSQGFDPPDCSKSVGSAPDGSAMPSSNAMKDAYSDSNGVFYPSRSYVKPMNSSGSPDDRDGI